MIEHAKEMERMTTLEGAVVVITGAGRGIGRAIARELGQGGAQIVVNYAHSKEPAEELVQWLREHGSQQAMAIQADVSDATQAASLINEAVQRLGRRIVSLTEIARLPDKRTDVDDLPALLIREIWYGSFDCVKVAVQIHLKHSIPVFHTEILQ